MSSLNGGYQRQDANPSKQRLLVVSNRLPVSPIRSGEDSWSMEISAGGLVSALLGVKEFESKWIGWAGVNVPDEIGQRSLTEALAEKSCIPVFLDRDIVNQYYNGYSNNILWPLIHNLGLPQEDRSITPSYESQLDAYTKANQMFADVVNEHYQEGDIVWCHDFHLMLLPQFLKENNSAMKVGWFLHSPFPSPEVHKTLPSRSELLRSVLAADLVGFHTYDFARNFVNTCTHILGLEATHQGLIDQGKLTRVAVYPIGIEPERFIRALELQNVQDQITELKEKFAGKKVIIGVDRLDMIKGIPQKILAFEKFLEDNPSWRDKVVLLQIAVPTRTDVPEYQKLTRQVHEIVGRVNGRFGTFNGVPIHHLDQSINFHTLCALYAVSDVALVTSLRDGMNLVSYEFVACQDSKKGVLILSEFAGAAQSLGAGALLVNPWNINEVASTIGNALNMPADERERRHQHNFLHVSTHTAQKWADAFLSEINDTIVEAQPTMRQVPPSLPVNVAVDRYLQSKNRLLILGFNTTLTEPMELKLHPDLKEPLRDLCNDPNTTIVVVSGSDTTVLDNNFGEYNMWLAAENGMFLRPPNSEWMTTITGHLNMGWVDSVKHVFDYFTERTPGSHVELRDTSLVWNFEHADVEFGRLQARDLLQHLWAGPISNAAVDVVQGTRSVDVRSVGVTKGATIDRILGEIVSSKRMVTPIDYVLCMGNFLGKDEDIYTFFEPELPSEQATTSRANVADPAIERTSNNNQMPNQNGSRNEGSSVLDLKGENYFSCAVGRKPSNARYLLGSAEEIVTFVKDLSEAAQL